MRQPHEFAAIHKAADYYEPLLRVRVKAALKALRASITVNEIAIAIAHKSPGVLTTKRGQALMAPAMKVVRDAVRQGGIIGAGKIHGR